MGWFPQLMPPTGVGFNGKKLQTNPNALQSGGVNAYLNKLKGAQIWGFGNNALAPVTPDLLDSNGYPNTMTGTNPSSGYYTVFDLPSPQQQAGAWIIPWDGDGTVTSASTNAAPVSYTIISVTQVGTVQTINLSSSPVEMVAGQPIGLSGIGGTWSALSNNFRVLDVNIAGNSFRVDSGTNYSGSATLSTPKATFITTTTVANVAGNLNGTGRYGINLNPLFGGGNGVGGSVAITAIQSSTNYPHNMRVVNINDEAALNAGQEFTQTFLDVMKEFGVVRWLNWQYGPKLNICNVTTWLTRKSRSYFAYSADERRSELYGGATSLSGRTYSVGAPAFNSATGAAWSGSTLSDKATIHVLISQGSWAMALSTFASGNPDISIPGHTYQVGNQIAFLIFNNNGVLPPNINANQYYTITATGSGTVQIGVTPSASSTGAIYSSGRLFLTVGTTPTKPILNTMSGIFQDNQWPLSSSANSLATFIFDAKLDSYIMYGGSGDWGSNGIINGAPYESELSLCTLAGAHPWWVTPYLAADPVTDFMPSLMKLVKDSAPSWMIPHWEPPNELWNDKFPQTPYAIAKAITYGWGADYYNWYGKVLSTLGQSAATIYGIGNLNATYRLLGGVQTPIFVSGDTGNSLRRFASTAYVGDGIAQAPLTGSWGTITFSAATGVAEAWRWTSHLAIANYYISNVYFAFDGPQTFSGLASDYNGAQFRSSSIAGGTMVVIPFDANAGDKGALPTSGMTVFGPNGVTFTITGGTLPNLTISNSGLSIAYQQSYTAGVDLTAPIKLAASVEDTVVNATITGSNFVINSIVSGNTIAAGLQVYGGTIPFASGVLINNGGTYPNFTLSSSPGNQTANFNIGVTFSKTGAANLYSVWANWAHTNFGINHLEGYEGGYSDDFGSRGAAFDLMAAQSKVAPNLQTYANDNFNNFRGIGVITYPVGVTGEFPSVFNTTGVYPVGDAWSVLDDIYQSPRPPQWLAIAAY